ncbi:MAG: hypothetical protein FWG74_09990, partial [Planctomycetes bacterium]|nr:hypothetical protein [Planctomycetota bacterium]
MNEQSNKRDKHWSVFLSRCCGEAKANPAFKADLFGKLKLKIAGYRQETDAADNAEDRNWSRFLSATHRPCESDSMFRERLLVQLKRKQAEMTAMRRTGDADDAIKLILTKTYTPVTARKEFQTRLLGNLRERQRENVNVRRKFRRRAFFLSALSSLSAAALVMLFAWPRPLPKTDVPSITHPGEEMAQAVMEGAPAIAEASVPSRGAPSFSDSSA